MGRASITNNLGLGRYRIKLDTGEARRVALVNAVNQALAIAGSKLTAAQEQVALADAQEAEARENITILISQIIALGNDEAAVGLARKVLAVEQQKYAKLVAQNQPVRRQCASLKDVQADLLRQRTAWESLQTITYKEAWCTDYTLSAGGSVATIDIPGDSSLTLIAPGCRAPRNGDGTISTASKAAALSRRANELISAGEKLSAVNVRITTATTEETALRAQVTAAQATYVATPTDENYKVFEAKTKELATKRHEIANLTLSKQTIEVTIGRLNQEIAYWTARAASETPYAGDGALLERELTSPAQAYFNAAILPGWQKWMPTYRWGTASNVNETTNTMDVTLGPATSSAQRLNVNKENSLNSVAVEYMTCHAAAFEDGDNVIVEFTGQSFESPKVIGFLDNPRECRAWPISVVMDLWFETVPGTSEGTRKWANVTAWYEEGAEAYCSGAPYNLAVTGYTANICESATHSFRLDQPEFLSDADNSWFDLHVDGGSFTTLWTGRSSAWSFDIGINSNRVPGGVSVANSIGLANLATNYIQVVEQTTTAYSQGMTYAPNFSSGGGACIYIQPESSGAWLHGGTNIEFQQPAVTTTYPLGETPLLANEFLDAMGASPGTISVTRKIGGKNPKTYILNSISQDSTLLYGGRRWRFTFTREDA